jgi:hypothetical protein
MNIQSLVTTPQLIEVVLDEPSLIETYGEPITFHTYDIVSMSVYFDFFNARSNSEFDMLTKLIKSMILDEKGKPVLTEEKDLPIDIVTASVIKLGEILGKSQGKKSTQKTGEVQN